jgi:hypothetical protein
MKYFVWITAAFALVSMAIMIFIIKVESDRRGLACSKINAEPYGRMDMNVCVKGDGSLWAPPSGEAGRG